MKNFTNTEILAFENFCAQIKKIKAEMLILKSLQRKKKKKTEAT